MMHYVTEIDALNFGVGGQGQSGITYDGNNNFQVEAYSLNGTF